MVWVDRRFGRRPPSAEALRSRDSLEAIFSDRAPKRSTWVVFAGVKKIGVMLKENEKNQTFLQPDWEEHLKQQEREAEEKGAKPGEIEVGTMVATLIRRGETHAELKNTTTFRIWAAVSPMLQKALTDFEVVSTAQFTLDTGLEEFTAKMHTGLGMEFVFRGVREQQSFRISQFIYNNEQALVNEHTTRIPLADLGTPTIAITPFPFRPQIREDDRWSVTVIDTIAQLGEARLAAWDMRVTGTKNVRLFGRTIHAFEVEAESDRTKAVAYYSADGRVLKQHLELADAMSVTMLLADESESDVSVPQVQSPRRFPLPSKPNVEHSASALPLGH